MIPSPETTSSLYEAQHLVLQCWARIPCLCGELRDPSASEELSVLGRHLVSGIRNPIVLENCAPESFKSDVLQTGVRAYLNAVRHSLQGLTF